MTEPAAPSPLSSPFLTPPPKRARTNARRTLIALYYALYLLPAALAVRFGAQYALWIASAAMFATAIRWLWEGGGAARRASALLLSLITVLANALLLISLLLLGTGFDAQFIFHFNWQTLLVALDAATPLLFGCCAYWLLASLWPICLPPRRAPRKTGALAAAMILGCVLNAPALSFAHYATLTLLAERRALLVPKPPRAAAPAERQPLRAEPSRSLVLIYAEALEQTFSDASVFGADQTPRLTALAEQGLRFANMQQVALTGWTTGALVATQCGLPMGINAHRDSLIQRLAFDARLPNATCLGDQLSRRGYRTTFMGGSSLAFAGMGSFLAEHGFADRIGLAALRPLLAKPDQVSPWGVYDDKLDRLARADAPFAFALVTLDTHSPAGYPSASCGKPDARAGKLFAVRCADRLIAGFIEATRRRHPQALVVLFSDHLAPFDSVLHARLAPHSAARRLRFVAWGPHIEPGVVARRGTHFDVAPTVLDLLGIDAATEHNFGASLLRQESPWLAYERPWALRVAYELPDLRLRSGDAVLFDPAGPAIEAGDLRMLATGSGLRLRDAVFAIALDADGAATGIRHFYGAGAADALAAWAANRSLIGVSQHAAFNQGAVGEPTSLAYFAGRPGTADFVAAPLRARQNVRLP